MTRRDLEEMLRKLQALGDDSDAPESKTALAIRKKLMASNGIAESDIGKREWRVVKIARGTEIIADAIGNWMKLEIRVHAATRRVDLCASKREKAVFLDLYAYSKEQYRAVQRSARRAVKGFLLGHLHGLYPMAHDPKLCPKCGAEGWGHYIDRLSSRIICESCHHKGDKLDFDPAAYFTAMAMAHKALPGPDGSVQMPQIETRPRMCGNCRYLRDRVCWNINSVYANTYPPYEATCGWHHWADEPKRSYPIPCQGEDEVRAHRRREGYFVPV